MKKKTPKKKPVEAERFSKKRIGALKTKVAAMKRLSVDLSHLQTKGGRRRQILAKHLKAYAGRREVKIGLRERTVKAIPALASEDFVERARAINLLKTEAVENSALVVEPLIAALKDGHPDIRHQAVIALGEMWDKRAFKPLTRMLNDRIIKVKARALRSLAEMASKNDMEKEAFPFVKKCFLEEVEGGKNAEVISEAMQAFKYFSPSKRHRDQAAGLALKVFEHEGLAPRHKLEAVDLCRLFLKGEELKRSLNVALKDWDADAGLDALIVFGRKYKEFLKGDDLKRIEVAKKFWGLSWEGDILQGMLVLRPDVRRNCPLSLDDARGRAFLTNLREQVKGRKAEELKRIIKWERGFK